MWAILQTAYNKQKYISSFLAHFHTINIWAADIKEAAYVLEDVDED